MKAINTKKTNIIENNQNDEFSQYHAAKEAEKECKKILSELKPIILTYIANGKSTSGQYEAKKIIKEKKTINEELAIEILRKTKVKGIIQTKEYIDTDALERAIEKELIDPSILAPAQEIQYITELRVNKIKGNNNG